ncbi:MAG: hypothetical protein WDO24_27820 [Pseudomonadota bacterium]
MLLVDDHEIEAEPGDDLGGVAGRRLEERADQLVAGEHPLSERTRLGQFQASGIG